MTTVRPLLQILNEDLPNSQSDLLKISKDCSKASQYLRENYILSKNKKIALRDTLNHATEYLTAVSVQINNLSNLFLSALDQQAEVLSDLTDQEVKLEAIIKAHKERIARKSIGACTAQKSVITYNHDCPIEMSQKYIRRPIDYTIFDNISSQNRKNEPNSIYNQNASLISKTMGHKAGVEFLQSQNAQVASNLQVTNQNSARYHSGTLGRSMGVYRSAMITNAAAAPQNLNLNDISNNVPPAAPLRPLQYATQSRRSSTSSNDIQAMNLQQKNPHELVSVVSGNQSHNGSAYSTPNHQPNLQRNLSLANTGNIGGTLQMPRRQMSLTNGQVPKNFDHIPYQQQHSLNLGNSNAKPMNHGEIYGVNMTINNSTGTGSHGTSNASNNSLNGAGELMAIPPPSAPLIINKAMGMCTKKPNDPIWAPDFYLEKVITMYEYIQDKDDELTFGEKEIIYVLKKNDDGWWEGIMNGITGLFPGNYVERCS